MDRAVPIRDFIDIQPGSCDIFMGGNKCLEWTTDGRVLVYGDGEVIGEFTKNGYVGIDE